MQPTPEQLEAAKLAFTEINGIYSCGKYEDGDPEHDFRLPEQTVDEDLKNIPNLPFDFKLTLAKSKITNDGLEALKRLDNLIDLNLYYTQINNDGVKWLMELPKLKYLDMGWTPITVSGAHRLRTLRNLVYINIQGSYAVERTQSDKPNWTTSELTGGPAAWSGARGESQA